MANDLDQVKAVGHATLALVNAAILVAILAVILAPSAQSGAIIQAFFSTLSWLVGQVVRPITGGSLVTLSSTLAPAGAGAMTATGAGGTPVQNQAVGAVVGGQTFGSGSTMQIVPGGQ